MRETLAHHLSGVLTVEAIMTAKQDLLAWDKAEDATQVQQQAKESGYDLIPIMEDGLLVSVMRKGSETPEPLQVDWLVTSDAGVHSLLQYFDSTGKPGLFVVKGQEIVGLVTPADLNKIPMRIYVYHVIGQLEHRLSRLIAHHYRDDAEAMLDCLSSDKQHKIRERHEQLREGNADVDFVQVMDFSHLGAIIRNTDALRHMLGFGTKSQFDDHFGGLEHLRNDTMHVVRPLIEDLEGDLPKLRDRLERAEDVLRTLSD